MVGLGLAGGHLAEHLADAVLRELDRSRRIKVAEDSLAFANGDGDLMQVAIPIGELTSPPWT